MNLGKDIIPGQIIILTVFSVVLNFIYLVWADSYFSLYILWNIVLAGIPFFISYNLFRYRKNSGKNLAIYIIGIILWLLFFPNAPYMVTDVIHVGESIGVPKWFDALTLFTSAWVGVMFGIYSLSHIEEMLLTKYSKKISTFLIALVALLTSVGIYLGRFFRYNSWDMVIHPERLFIDIWRIFSMSQEYSNAYFFIFIFFLFILVSYYSWKFNKGEMKK